MVESDMLTLIPQVLSTMPIPILAMNNMMTNLLSEQQVVAEQRMKNK